MAKIEGISTNSFIKKLVKKVDELGGPERAGVEWGEYPSVIREAIKTQRLPSPNILKGMGFEKVRHINYRYKEVK